MGAVTYPTLEHVAMEARPYPVDVLAGAETGLVLFAAAFLGHNDAVHFAQAGIRATCVDTDEERLEQMRELYPDDWDFAASDAWTYARAAQELELVWDVVSLDPFTGDAMARVLEDLELWTEIANRAVIVGAAAGAPPRVVTAPDGWNVTAAMIRSPAADWLVLEREA